MRGSLSSPSYLVRNPTLALQLEENHEETPDREMRAFISCMA